MLNCDDYIEILETIKLCVKKETLLSTKCIYKSYIYLFDMYKYDLVLNTLQWLICHKSNQTNQTKQNKYCL